jgi:hypothetical protein
MDGIQGTRGGVRMGTQEWEQAWTDSDAIEGQGMAQDATFHDLDRDVTRARTWCHEDGDAKAWQGEDEDRKAGSQR